MNGRAHSIYRLVCHIPRGKVLSYGEVGRLAGASARQVGAAMRECPAVVPWHRVVGSGGRLLTPGDTAWRQRELLILEGVRFRGKSVLYSQYQWNAPGLRRTAR